MRMTTFDDLTFILAQINPTIGDLSGNAKKITDVINAHHDADIIIFPELVLSGYPPEDLVLRPAFIADVEQHLQNICNATREFKSLALISAPIMQDQHIYNAVAVISDGAIQHVIPKHHLPNYDVFDEVRVFASGDLPNIVQYKGVKLGICTCEDMWFDDVPAHLKMQGADIMISVNGSPYDVNKTAYRTQISEKHCVAHDFPHIYVNQVGGQDELVFDGGSFVMDSRGQMIHQSPLFKEDIATFSFKHDHGLVRAENISPYKDIYDALCLGVRDYVLKNGFKSVLIGLSGGIDSALTAVIAADAIGAENVHCVMMPSPYTAQISLDDAAQLAKNLGCPYQIIEIEDAMASLEHMIGEDAKHGLTAENIQSRLRGLTLMALSNARGAMVLTTGNKSEMAVGYATLYGDMCGGFNALKDIYKTDVFALSHYVNESAGHERIPKRIITRPPSAELRPDQRDEDSLPPYEQLDAILKAIIEDQMPLTEIVKLGHDREMVLKIQHLLNIAEYKRRQAPPGVKITQKAFGKDRRYPITNQYREDA